ncbi:MAG: response regulator [Anaerolineales bacterium]
MKTILIVEDTELNIDLLTQLLEDDYQLVIARDGEQGIQLANEKKPDLILMDISLPTMDGYEATHSENFTVCPLSASLPTQWMVTRKKQSEQVVMAI